MAKIIEVEIEVGSKQALKSLNDLETAQEKLLEQLKQTEIGTKEYDRLRKQLKQVGSQVKDLELGFESLDKEQRAAALVDSFSGLAGAITAATGVFSLFGAESEQLAEVEKRLLSLIAVVSGLREVSDGLVAAQKLAVDGIGKVGDALKTSFTTATGAINGTKVALTSLGIGAVILLISALIDASNELSAVQKKQAEEAEELAKFNEEIRKGIDKETASVSALIAITENETTTKEQKTEAIKQIQKIYPEYLANQDLDKVSTTDIAAANEDLTKAILKRAEAQAYANKISALGGEILDKQLKLDKIQSQLESARQYAATQNFTQRETELYIQQLGIEVGRKQLEQDLESLEAEQQGLVTKAQTLGLIQNITTANDKNKDSTKAATKTTKELTQAEKDAAKAKEEWNRKTEAAADIAAMAADEVAEITLSSRDKEIDDIKDSYRERLALLTEVYGIESQEVKNLTILQNQEIAEINDRYDQEEKDKIKAKEQEKADLISRINAALVVTAEEQRQAEIDSITKYYDDLIAEARKAGLDITAIEEAKNKKLAELRKSDQESRNEDIQSFSDNFNQFANAAKDLVSSVGDFQKATVEAQQNALQAQFDQGLLSQEEYDKKTDELNKKAFEQNKKVSIASAIISTLQGAIDAFTGTLKIDPTGILGSVLAAAALAAGFAQVDAIKSTSYSSTGAPPAAGFAGASPSTKALTGRGTNTGPQVPISIGPSTTGGGVGPGGVVQTGQTGGGGSVFKTYVLSGDVTSAQDADFRLKTQRKL